AAELERERRELVEPALPRVREKLWDDLLLAEIWDRVLDDRAQRMLYRMTLLRVPWERELNLILGEPGEAEEQAGETAERLRRTSLLEQIELWRATGDGQAARVRHFTLHPATTQFIVERFGSDEELRRATHLRVGEYLEGKITSTGSGSIGTILEAGHHLLRGGESDRAYVLLGPASDWLQKRGRVREGLRTLEPFLDEPVLRALRPELADHLLGTVGLAHHRLAEVEKAIGYHQEALVIAREIGNRRGEGEDLGNLAGAYSDLGDVEKAIGYYEQAIVIAREIGDRSVETEDLGSLGLAYARLGDVEKAIVYYEQGLVIAREICNRHSEGSILGNLGVFHYRLGDVEKAIGYYEQALIIDREIGDPRGEGMQLNNLGLAYARLGDVEKAIGYHEQGLVIAREIGNRSSEGRGLGTLGLAYARLGEVKKAIGMIEQALRIGQEIKDPEIGAAFSAQLEKLRGSSTP
ncbi:MAG: tetratricopeptide repeat protein, partial [bacterium]|nr:tetratricopeptide repeat protein [bacterium]